MDISSIHDSNHSDEILMNIFLYFNETNSPEIQVTFAVNVRKRILAICISVIIRRNYSEYVPCKK